MAEDRVRVLRIVEYEGPRSWVETIIRESIHGEKVLTKSGERLTIRTATVGEFPEILTKG